MLYSGMFHRILLLTTLVSNFPLIGYHYSVYANTSMRHLSVQSAQGPIINDPKLKAEVVFKGLNFPTSMAFLGPNDILVLEKNDGTVRRIVNGTMLPHPLLHVNVANEIERGLLGIAITKTKNNNNTHLTTYIFLYYTENKTNSPTLPSDWDDPAGNCNDIFNCSSNVSSGWKDNTSFQISTNTTNKNMWSYITGKEIDVNPAEQYQLVSHMKLNKLAVQSHIAIEGYNTTSNKWYQLKPGCVLGSDGPLEWHEFSCKITIPKDTIKIRPVLNAGWSSQPGKEAVTLFDAIYLSKIYPNKTSSGNTINSNLIANPELGVKSANNRLYRYELVNDKLVHPKLLLNLPATHFFHVGGKIVIGSDKNVYITIGDIGEDTKVINVENARDPNGTGGVLRVTQDGRPVKGILGDKIPLNLYYAYGIRNSFGMDYDPMTGKLWDTENGAECCDEINLVEPGFNSGWIKVQGIWEPLQKGNALIAGRIDPNPANLVDFGGKGKYRAPEFTWLHTVGPTALKFLNSSKLGRQYQNDMFVGDFHYGNLYHFKLNKQRNGLLLSGPLATKVAANSTEPAIQSIIFGHGFGGITDLQVGPDGYLYILSLYAGGDNCDPIHPRPCIQYNSPLPGTIFRITPNTSAH